MLLIYIFTQHFTNLSLSTKKFHQVISQVETNDSLLIMDFMAKRGAKVEFGPTAAPPSGWMTHKEGSDVVVAFAKTLAVFKVSCSNLYFCF